MRKTLPLTELADKWHLHRSTINRYLHRLSLHSRVMRKTFLLNKDKKAGRVAWGHANRKPPSRLAYSDVHRRIALQHQVQGHGPARHPPCWQGCQITTLSTRVRS